MCEQFRRDQRGNVAVLFGILLPVLAIAVGAAVDYSDLTARRSDLQGAADAAALAAAKELALSVGQPDHARVEAAKRAGEHFARSQAPGADYIVEPSADDETAVARISIAKTPFFDGLLGTGSRTVAVSATATYRDPNSACIVALGPDESPGIGLVGSAKINAPRCGIRSDSKSPNSITTQGAAKIAGSEVCAAGGSKASSTPPVKTGCAASGDPLAPRLRKRDRGSSVDSATNGNSGQGGKPSVPLLPASGNSCTEDQKPELVKTFRTYGPGLHCGGIHVQSADVVLLPGVHEFRNGPLSLQGKASLQGTGVTLLFTGTNAVLDLQGSPSMTLTAMYTGHYAGIAIVSDTPASPILTSRLQGSPDVTVTGAIYLPTQRLELQGSPTLTLNGRSDKLIALSLHLHGSPDITVKSDSKQSAAESLASLRLIR